MAYSSKPKKWIIEVDISNIQVDDRYYNFDYIVTVNGEVRPKEMYSSDHAWQNEQKYFKQLLKSGLAAQTVLESLRL